jgi:hypothetical protein
MATEKSQVTVEDFLGGMFDLQGSQEFKKVMIYGPPGLGKTSLVGTLPPPKKGKYHLILAGEPGFITAARRGLKAKVRLIPDTATMLAALAWLEGGAVDEIDWIVVEGTSTMQNKWLLGYAAEAFDNRPASRTHRNLPDKPDYLNAQNALKGFVTRFVDLPCNVLFTAHAMYPEDSDGDPMITANIQGKGHEVSDYVLGQMLAVGYFTKVNVRVPSPDDPEKKVSKEARRIYWQSRKSKETGVTIIAKDQTDTLGRWTDDMTLAEIIALMDTVTDPVIEEATEEPPAKKAAPKKQANVKARLRA